MLPLRLHDQPDACLCARLPNDVVGDLIQREAGHIFHESGDNYLFMVQARFDPAIAPGTALSRSCFEDRTFSGGDNLKDGVKTAYGVVRVQQHTELELIFNDPATGQLHPGVRETIRHGENLFVTYPGYADYRHIPVIGKGIRFQLPGSPDVWGIMCEADLAEVYRYRSVSQQLLKGFVGVQAGCWRWAMPHKACWHPARQCSCCLAACCCWPGPCCTARDSPGHWHNACAASVAWCAILPKAMATLPCGWNAAAEGR
jgi:hypothetical protein